MTLHTRIFVDSRDGDGLCSHNPGDVYFWLCKKRPREDYRSQEYAQIADMVHYERIPPELRRLATTYQLVVI